MKRLLALFVGCALVLCGCAQTTQTPTSIRIGVALYQQDDTFISTLVQNLEKMTQEEEVVRDIKITLNLSNANSSQTTQNEQIDRFLSLDYDVICVNIVDRTAAAVLIDKAKAKGVPIIFFNREPVKEDLDRWEEAYYVGSEATLAGTLQGNMVADAWYTIDRALDKNDDGILQYVMLEGEPGHQDTLLRTEYSIRAIEERGIQVERLSSASANWSRGQGETKMNQWLGEFGDTIELVLCNNDDMALGVIDAYQKAEIPLEELPFIVGVDATPAALTAMDSGYLKGTVRNDAEGQARAILDLSYLLAMGEDPTDTLDLEDNTYIWQQYTAVLP